MTVDWNETTSCKIFISSGSKVTKILESIICHSVENLMWQIVPAGMLMCCFGYLTDKILDSFWDCNKLTNGSRASDE